VCFQASSSATTPVAKATITGTENQERQEVTTTTQHSRLFIRFRSHAHSVDRQFAESIEVDFLTTQMWLLHADDEPHQCPKTPGSKLYSVVLCVFHFCMFRRFFLTIFVRRSELFVILQNGRTQAQQVLF
jgi:hypothetical protein